MKLTVDAKGADAKMENLNAAIELTNTWISVSGECDPEDAEAFLDAMNKKIGELRKKALKQDKEE